jgi:hypothetical protein
MNSQLVILIRLARMRRSTGATRLRSITWATGLVWRSHL